RRPEGRADRREPSGERGATHAPGRSHLGPGPAQQRRRDPRGGGRRTRPPPRGPRSGLRRVRTGRERRHARSWLRDRADARGTVRGAAWRTGVGRGAGGRRRVVPRLAAAGGWGAPAAGGLRTWLAAPG